MSIISQKEKCVTIRPGKAVISTMTNNFRAELQAIIDESPPELVMDFDGVDMIDSVGIGLIITTHNSLEKRNGKLKIINITKDIYMLLRSMRLTDHFDIECRLLMNGNRKSETEQSS